MNIINDIIIMKEIIYIITITIMNNICICINEWMNNNNNYLSVNYYNNKRQ